MDAVGLQVQTPDFVGKLNQLLSIKSQQAQLPGITARSQMEVQSANQRAAMANIDWDKHMSEDGTLDLNSFIKDQDIRKAAGDAYPQLVDQAIGIKSHQLEAKGNLLKLTTEQVGAYGQMLGALANDEDVVKGTEAGKAKAKAAFTQFAQTYGMDAAKAVAPIALPLMNDQIPADKIGKMIQHVQMQAQDVGQQLEKMRPNIAMVQGPQGLQPVNVNAYAPGGIGPTGAPIEQGVSPSVILDPTTGNPVVLKPGGTVRPVTTTDQRPFGLSYPGQKEDVARNQEEVRSTRLAGDQAPLSHNINQQILRLSSDAHTGPGSDTWQHVIGALGAPLGLSPTASYQELGKYLEKNAIANMQSMGGPPSDARLSAAAAANGSTVFSPEALKAVTKFNDATTTGLQLYRQGLDQAVGLGRSADYLKLPEFKSKWAKNFDVDVFRFDNALRDGDTTELNRIKSELGPQGAKELMRKRKALHALAEHGDLSAD